MLNYSPNILKYIGFNFIDILSALLFVYLNISYQTGY